MPQQAWRLLLATSADADAKSTRDPYRNPVNFRRTIWGVCGVRLRNHAEMQSYQNILYFMQMRAQNGAVFQIFAESERVNFTLWNRTCRSAKSSTNDLPLHTHPSL